MNAPAIHKRFNSALDAIIAKRDSALRLPAGRGQRTRLAELFDQEAALWGELHEATSSSVQARAAIRARQYAQSEATRLRSRQPHQPVRTV